MRALMDRLCRDELGAMADSFTHISPVFIERVYRNIEGAAVWCDVIQSAAVETCADIARALHALAAVFARLPWPWLMAAGDALAALWLRRDVRESRVARINLRLAYPGLRPAEREALHRAVLRTTARQLVETLRLWSRPRHENLALLRETYGVERFDAAIASGRGVIVAAPHHGNWELLNQWLANHTALAILYRPPESAIGEAFLNRVRASHGDPDRVTQVRAEGAAVRQLFKLLRDGGVVGILPDQQPKAGDGEFAPFFGVPALTMTLVGRLAERTGADRKSVV